MAWYAEAKVYFDGSHYIAIPHTTRPSKRRAKIVEETITVIDEIKDSEVTEPSISVDNMVESFSYCEDNENCVKKPNNKDNQELSVRQLTKKELFEELYLRYIDLKKNERKKKILKDMRIHFEDDKKCEDFVNTNFDRKLRNLICRRVRMTRKANLVNFNYYLLDRI